MTASTDMRTVGLTCSNLGRHEEGIGQQIEKQTDLSSTPSGPKSVAAPTQIPPGKDENGKKANQGRGERTQGGCGQKGGNVFLGWIETLK